MEKIRLTPVQKTVLGALSVDSIQISSKKDKMFKTLDSLLKKDLVTMSEEGETMTFSIKEGVKVETKEEEQEVPTILVEEKVEAVVEEKVVPAPKKSKLVALTVKKGDMVRLKEGVAGIITKYSSNKEITLDTGIVITKEDILEVVQPEPIEDTFGM